MVAAALGDRQRAEAVFQWLDTLEGAPRVRFHWQAEIAANLGQREEAVTRLREWLTEPDYSAYVFTNCAFRFLQDYPPFQELMEPKG